MSNDRASEDYVSALDLSRTASVRPRPLARLAGSALWILLGAFFLLASRSIPAESFAGASDPGPALLPRIAAGVLLIGGIVDALFVLFRVWTKKSGHRVDHPSSIPATERQSSQSDRLPWHRVKLLLPSFAVLLWAFVIPWIGFATSCWLFVTFWLLASRMRVWQVLVFSTLFVAIIVLLFGQLFEVQLPRGKWGGP